MAYTQNVSGGMTVTGEVVDSGIQIIGSGGIASNAVASGGAVQVNSGGVSAASLLMRALMVYLLALSRQEAMYMI